MLIGLGAAFFAFACWGSTASGKEELGLLGLVAPGVAFLVAVPLLIGGIVQAVGALSAKEAPKD